MRSGCCKRSRLLFFFLVGCGATWFLLTTPRAAQHHTSQNDIATQRDQAVVQQAVSKRVFPFVRVLEDRYSAEAADVNSEDYMIESYLSFFVCIFLCAAALQWLVSHITVYNIPVSIIWFLFGMGLDLAVFFIAPDNLSSTSKHQNRFLLVNGIIYIGKINAEVVYLLFLPILLYDASLNIEWHHFKRFAYSGITLAVLGVGYQVAVVGLLSKLTFSEPLNDFASKFPDVRNATSSNAWSNSFLIASAMASTDPVAVISVLHGLQAPVKLATMFEGESLINDGSSMLLFQFFKSLSRGDVETWNRIVLRFFSLLFLAPVLGCSVAALVYRCVKRFRRYPDMQVLMLITMGYTIYFVGEKYIQTSGPIAIVCYGLYYTAFGHIGLGRDAQKYHHHSVHALASLANTSVFTIAGVVAMRMIMQAITEDNGVPENTVWHVPLLYLYLLVGRASMVLFFLPILRRTGYGVNWKETVLLVWGGLRGAIVLAMGLMIEQDYHILSIMRYKAVLYIAGTTLLLLLINGVSFELLFRYLNPYPAKPFRRVYLERVMKLIDYQYLEERAVLENHWLFRGTHILDVANKAVPVLGWRRMDKRGKLDFELPNISHALTGILDQRGTEHFNAPGAAEFIREKKTIDVKPLNAPGYDTTRTSVVSRSQREESEKSVYNFSETKRKASMQKDALQRYRTISVAHPSTMEAQETIGIPLSPIEEQYSNWGVDESTAQQRAHATAVASLGLREPRRGQGDFDAKYYMRLVEHVTEPAEERLAEELGTKDHGALRSEPSFFTKNESSRRSSMFSPSGRRSIELLHHGDADPNSRETTVFLPMLSPGSHVTFSRYASSPLHEYDDFPLPEESRGKKQFQMAAVNEDAGQVLDGTMNSEKDVQIKRYDTDRTIVFPSSTSQENVEEEGHLKLPFVRPPVGRRLADDEVVDLPDKNLSSNVSSLEAAAREGPQFRRQPSHHADYDNTTEEGLAESELHCSTVIQPVNISSFDTCNLLDFKQNVGEINAFSGGFSTNKRLQDKQQRSDEPCVTKKGSSPAFDPQVAGPSKVPGRYLTVSPSAETGGLIPKIVSEPLGSNRLDIARMTRLRIPEWHSRRTTVDARLDTWHEGPRDSDFCTQDWDSLSSYLAGKDAGTGDNEPPFHERLPSNEFTDAPSTELNIKKQRYFNAKQATKRCEFRPSSADPAASDFSADQSRKGRLRRFRFRRRYAGRDKESRSSAVVDEGDEFSSHVRRVLSAPTGNFDIQNLAQYIRCVDNLSIGSSEEFLEIPETPRLEPLPGAERLTPTLTQQQVALVKVLRKEREGELYIMAFNAIRQMYRRLYEQHFIGGSSMLSLMAVLDCATDFAIGKLRRNPIRAWKEALSSDVQGDEGVAAAAVVASERRLPACNLQDMTGFEFEWRVLKNRLMHYQGRYRFRRYLLKKFPHHREFCAALMFRVVLSDLQQLSAFVDVHEELLWKGGSSLAHLLGPKLLASYNYQIEDAKAFLSYFREVCPDAFRYALAVHAATLLVNLKLQLVEEQEQKGLILEEDSATLNRLFEEHHQNLAFFRPMGYFTLSHCLLIFVPHIVRRVFFRIRQSCNCFKARSRKVSRYHSEELPYAHSTSPMEKDTPSTQPGSIVYVALKSVCGKIRPGVVFQKSQLF